MGVNQEYPPSSFGLVFDECLVSHFRLKWEHLYVPALRQLHRVLRPGGYFVTSGCLKPFRGWTMEHVIELTEAEGFRTLTTENMAAGCVRGCEAMSRHVFGDGCRPAIPPTEQDRFPEEMQKLKKFLHTYREGSADGSKPLVCLVFQKCAEV
eukprot:NODE_6456_length_533_cov_5.596059_g6291_i0.p1 GENE.NODE_6456_length_533_cov_5.596059_g6291_i0~~NODE_6456_length_533_cov_5.596059_g6291_i0.p1  ORF type:complete len:152 (-),score=27.55 NODE_6456_length_533_cov_5.596059_g6291_i0:76-531(-)